YPGVLTVGSTGPGGGSTGGGSTGGGSTGGGSTGGGSTGGPPGGGAAPGGGVSPGGDGGAQGGRGAAGGGAGPGIVGGQAPPPGLRVPVATGRVDLVAPGVDVVAAVPGGGYARVSGSGVAAAEVAGVVALLWAVNPDLTGDLTRTRALLLDTATPIPASPACTGRM